MLKLAILRQYSGWIDLEFKQREWTPQGLMAFGIRLHLVSLSISSTIQ